MDVDRFKGFPPPTTDSIRTWCKSEGVVEVAKGTINTLVQIHVKTVKTVRIKDNQN